MTEPAIRHIEARPLSTVKMRSIEWLEKPLWQRSAFQLLAGPKGSGKGTYLAALASRISHTGQNVIFVSSEDSAEIDLVPRLVAAGANMDYCHDIVETIHLPDDLLALQRLGQRMQPLGMFVIDPVANHIGDRDSNADVQIRDAIGQLNGLANDLSCLLIGVRHPGKDRSRGALASILGSTAWVDVPRAVVFIARDDQDKAVRHIQVVAGNRTPDSKAQHFRIVPHQLEGLDEPVTRCIDLGQSEKDVDELLAMAIKEPSKTDKAKSVLLDILEERGDQNSDVLDAEVAKKVGLAAKTIRNVRAELKSEGLIGVRPIKTEENQMVDHWIVYRTLEPRQGQHYASPVPDSGNQDGHFVEQAKSSDAGNGLGNKEPDSTATNRALDIGDPEPEILNGHSGTGLPPLISDRPFVKQAKKTHPAVDTQVQCPTSAKPPRARLPFEPFDHDPDDEDPGAWANPETLEPSTNGHGDWTDYK
ncbi:MAG TPA: AAA family ATPase [Dehalococcoidia bacterium]|nr:AAA family ATPase [Dehalococcoidia bacterium]